MNKTPPKINLKSLVRRFQSTSGFTLLEAMIAAASGMIVIGGLFSGLSAMSTLSQRSAMSSNSANFQQELADSLKSGVTCTNALSGQTVVNSMTAPGSVTLNNILNGGSIRDLSVGTVVDMGVTISTLKLVRYVSTPSTDTTVETSTGLQTAVLASLHVQTSKQGSAGAASLSQPIDIPLKLVIDGSNRVTKCNTDTDEGRFCTESGGTWDPSLPVAADRCQPKSTCQFAGSFAPQGKPGAYPNEMTNTYGCQSPYVAVRSGTISQAMRTSKYGVGNTYTPVYTCVRCGTSLPVVSGDPGVPANTAQDYAGDAVPITTTLATGADSATVAAVPTPTPVPFTPGNGHQGGGGGNGGCFLGGTQVTMAGGQTKAIEDVIVGDQVLSYDERGHTTYVSTVTNTLHHPSADQFLYDVFMDDGKNFVANGVHWIYVVEAGRYLRMKDIYKIFSDHQTVTAIDQDNRELKISSIRPYHAIRKVYNLHVSGLAEDAYFENQGIGHNYFAGGVLVHNINGQHMK